MVSLANAVSVDAVERALVHGSPAQSLFNRDIMIRRNTDASKLQLAGGVDDIMNRRNTDVSEKQPADGVDDRGTPESDPFWRRDSAMGSDIHVPIGQDVATYLGKVSNDAFRWTVCQRKMGLFQLASAADGGDFESYCERVRETWAMPDLSRDEEAKTEWKLLEKMPSPSDG